MRSIKLLLLLAIGAITLLLACQKEFSTDNFIPVGPGTGNTPNITAIIMGRVVDETGKPVSGAEIRTTNLSVFTNINGEFRLQNVNVYDKAAFVQVLKSGYFTGSRTFVARQGESHYIEVKLLPKTSNGVLNSSAGGTVTLTNGASVTLPASAVVNKSTNTAYTGSVDVSVRWIDPTSADLTMEMPGDLRGIDNNNTEVGLQTFGMLAVELKGSTGSDLQIAPDKKAALRFPLPPSIAASAPATIALWSFNEANGLWKQEGTATKAGNFYEAEVSHFSFWNCDAPFPVVDFTATVKDQNKLQVVQKLVKIKRSDGSFSAAFTDSSGVVKGKVPSGEALTFEVLNSCNAVMFSQNIGPYITAASIEVAANVTNPQGAVITGNVVNCSGSPVANGSVEMIMNQRTYRAKVTGGAFTFNISVCSNNQAGTLVAIDSAAGQQGTSSITVNQGANNAGTLTACGVSTNQFINFSVSGTPYNLASPADSLNAYRQGTTTYIQGSKIATGGTVGSSNIYLIFTGSSTGSFTSLYVGASVPFPIIDSTTSASTVSITVTEYGNVGEYIGGSFTGNLYNTTGTAFPVQGTFRVRRRS